MTIKIEELRSFVSVAEEGSFSGAARRLHRAQSVVSTHVAGIEAELGFALFIREPAPIVTPAACELLPIARRVLAESARFESRAAALFDLPEPVLYIGIDMGLEVPLILDLVKVGNNDTELAFELVVFAVCLGIFFKYEFKIFVYLLGIIALEGLLKLFVFQLVRC